LLLNHWRSESINEIRAIGVPHISDARAVKSSNSDSAAVSRMPYLAKAAIRADSLSGKGAVFTSWVRQVPAQVILQFQVENLAFDLVKTEYLLAGFEIKLRVEQFDASRANAVAEFGF